MNILSTLVHSLLLSIAHSQSCDNTHTGSLLLSVSINGRMADKIGKSTYLDVIEQAAEAITQTSGQNVGINWFGGQSALNTQVGNILDISSSPSDVSDGLSDLNTTLDWDSHYGNSVSSSMSSATSTLASETGQRYHVVFTAGNPLTATGNGAATNPSNFDDPCSNSITAKQSR